MKRTSYAGSLTEADLGRHVTVAGWVQARRDMGGVIFVDLRDRSGTLQLVLNAMLLPAKDFSLAEHLKGQSVVAASGTLRLRDEETYNPKLATGTTDELRLEIHGDRGALRYNSLEPGRLYYYDAAAPADPIGGLQGFTAIECGGHYPAPGGGFPGGKFGTSFLRGHIHSLYTFLDNAAAGRPGTPSFADGAYIQSVMERILRSHQTGQWETL